MCFNRPLASVEMISLIRSIVSGAAASSISPPTDSPMRPQPDHKIFKATAAARAGSGTDQPERGAIPTPPSTPGEEITSVKRCRPSATRAGDLSCRPRRTKSHDRAALMKPATPFAARPTQGASKLLGARRPKYASRRIESAATMISTPLLRRKNIQPCDVHRDARCQRVLNSSGSQATLPPPL